MIIQLKGAVVKAMDSREFDKVRRLHLLRVYNFIEGVERGDIDNIPLPNTIDNNDFALMVNEYKAAYAEF